MNIKKNSKNNTYYFSISFGFDAITGKRKQTMRSGFRTIKEAEQEYNRLKHLNFEGKYQQSKRISINFNTLIDIYAKERIDKIKATTFNNEQGHIKQHILPYFADVNIHKVTRNAILDYRENLKTKNISNNTINKIMLSLKMIFDIAVVNGYLTITPYQNIKQLKVEKQKMNFWTPQEFQQFIKSVEENEHFIYHLFFTFAYLTGARLSELLACRYEDINFYTQIWRVSHSLNYNSITKNYYLDTSKTTSSLRSISLPTKLMQMITQHKTTHQKDFIFAQETDTPQGRHFDRIFRKHIKLSGVNSIRFHDLRHSHVALLINMEEQDFIIKERMGHASIKITYDIYGHLFPTRQKELADRLNNIL